jgi:hypothetical protein
MRTAVEWVKAIAESFEFKNQDSEYLKNGDEVQYQFYKKTSLLFEAECLEEFGGEDQGSEYWKVFKFKDLETNEEVYVKFECEYNSWDSSDWEDDPFFVTPVEKAITVYEVLE